MHIDRNLDEFVEFWDVLSLRVAVEKKRRVVFRRHQSLVQRLEVRRQIVNPLSVKKLETCIQKHVQYTHKHGVYIAICRQLFGAR